MFSALDGSLVIWTVALFKVSEAKAAATATLTFFGNPLMASITLPSKITAFLSVGKDCPLRYGAPSKLLGALVLPIVTSAPPISALAVHFSCCIGEMATEFIVSQCPD